VILIDLGKDGLSGRKAEQALELANITVNKNMVPFDTRSPFVTSGIRVGTPALTTRGMVEKDMGEIAHWMHQVLVDPDNEQVLESVRGSVRELCTAYPLY
jgi:glycine hydroxymethyltransferase